VYAIHAWFQLSESTTDPDAGGLDPAIKAIRDVVDGWDLETIRPDLVVINGTYSLTLIGDTNRRRAEESQRVNALIDLVRARLRGSYGLIYERDDERTTPPGPNAYQVTVLARGHLTSHPDPFLSPMNPTIED
jgi:immunity protein 7 of polymorphic toxin system